MPGQSMWQGFQDCAVAVSTIVVGIAAVVGIYLTLRTLDEMRSTRLAQSLPQVSARPNARFRIDYANNVAVLVTIVEIVNTGTTPACNVAVSLTDVTPNQKQNHLPDPINDWRFGHLAPGAYHAFYWYTSTWIFKETGEITKKDYTYWKQAKTDISFESAQLPGRSTIRYEMEMFESFNTWVRHCLLDDIHMGHGNAGRHIEHTFGRPFDSSILPYTARQAKGQKQFMTPPS